VLGTDLSTRAVDRARAAVWPLQKAKEIPAEYLRAFMLRGTGPQEGMMKALPALCASVRIEQLNLNAEAYPVLGLFDLVFCRNVLIYFSAQTKTRVMQRLLDHLAPAGLLFLGHAEGLSGMTEQLRGVAPTVYRKAEAPPRDSRTALRDQP
jgi:chemotaxis protein methyltransferase CheR